MRKHPFPHRGKGGRYDLLCNVPGWPRDTTFIRVVGWGFLNAGHMSWEEYQKKQPHRKKKGRAQRYEYKHQVNHIHGSPEDVFLKDLELGTAAANARHYRKNAKELYMSVWKVPMKRPASSIQK